MHCKRGCFTWPGYVLLTPKLSQMRGVGIVIKILACTVKRSGAQRAGLTPPSAASRPPTATPLRTVRSRPSICMILKASARWCAKRKTAASPGKPRHLRCLLHRKFKVNRPRLFHSLPSALQREHHAGIELPTPRETRWADTAADNRCHYRCKA